MRYVLMCQWEVPKSEAHSIVISACENNTYRPRHLTCRMCPSLVRVCVSFSLQAHQAAKGAHNSYGDLIDLLESIECLLKPLEIYTLVPPTPSSDDMIVKIMVELLSTLALTTKELKEGRSSESVVADV